MTATASDIAAVLRQRLPDVGVKKLHKLLYYCQGHHLAQTEEPLFAEQISAWDMGPVVGKLWYQEKETGPAPSTAELTESELNTIGYVLSRYGSLTGKDLENLTHGEAPWKLANRDREPRGSVTIKQDWMKGYFQTDGAPGDADDDPLDTEQVKRWLAETTNVEHEAKPDDLERLRARMARSA